MAVAIVAVTALVQHWLAEETAVAVTLLVLQLAATAMVASRVGKWVAILAAEIVLQLSAPRALKHAARAAVAQANYFLVVFAQQVMLQFLALKPAVWAAVCANFAFAPKLGAIAPQTAMQRALRHAAWALPAELASTADQAAMMRLVLKPAACANFALAAELAGFAAAHVGVVKPANCQQILAIANFVLSRCSSPPPPLRAVQAVPAALHCADEANPPAPQLRRRRTELAVSHCNKKKVDFSENFKHL